jgi:hypothetical protein
MNDSWRRSIIAIPRDTTVIWRNKLACDLIVLGDSRYERALLSFLMEDDDDDDSVETGNILLNFKQRPFRSFQKKNKSIVSPSVQNPLVIPELKLFKKNILISITLDLSLSSSASMTALMKSRLSFECERSCSVLSRMSITPPREANSCVFRSKIKLYLLNFQVHANRCR